MSWTRSLRLAHSRFLVAALSGGAWLGAATVASAQQALTETQRIVHVLNRLGYGPRAGDVARVRAMGIEAYIEQQLHPERIPDDAVEARLAQFPELRMTLVEAMEYDRPAAAVAVRRREPAVRKAYLSGEGGRGMSGQGADADSARALRRELVNPYISAMVTRSNRRVEDFAGVGASRMIRAVESDRQLLEALVDFWYNHFNIRVGDPYLINHWTEQVIRPNALGRFEDLLVATATHPAMMIYLDNWLSSAPEEVVRQRLASWDPPGDEPRELAVRRRMDFLSQTKGLNENYARELMELHTLGVEGGYTQQDVRQVARAFTGWTLTGPREDGDFAYDPMLHEDGDKVVLGQTIRSGGQQEGMTILHMLATHPSTAHFVSFKLARRFVADDPPPAVVDAAAKVFLETDGDIRAVLQTLFSSPEFFDPKYHQVKFKKPLDMVLSALRAVNAQFDQSQGGGGGIINRTLRDMGEPLGQHEAPDGYPDVATAWVSTSNLYHRIDFALALTSGQIPGLRVDLEAAARLFEEIGYSAPTAEQITQARILLARRAGGGDGAGAGMMVDETAGGEMGKGMGAGAGPLGEPSPQELSAIAAAIHLGSPAFQKR